ncbi:MAG: methionine adenosyltransferase [Dehalococcoidia bacterium]|jgi:S-adenosylmethionine synthetase|nr:methionine adenosyltransferase [Chloroflexota bacterium]MCH2494461.1 methionine adenosyltransferase [Dehalococcoidia bacterium]MQF84474.1 methionine adenosyltransferase [SAR202 cluster bacterium]MED5237878.1 methionine adenosyltransferase [Chloroflexota bacterium]MQF93331.1 methionine adenosyltransferase [SAR202 cluster bacterium]|tara:strand:+ start:49986 stop:51179 length:1194 start_codon:yes stop_codon:yes gene_type:complete
MANYFFTSESVSEGHPDKMCDQISDAILDECFRQDKFSRVACETAVGGQHGEGFAMVFGEITTNANLDYTKIIKDTVKNIGYTKDEYGYTPDSIKILNNIGKQSQDIKAGVDNSLETRGESAGDSNQQGAGDQGMMFGYACDETDEKMPLAITLAHDLLKRLSDARKNGEISYLRPDSKSQVTLEYDQNHNVVRVDTIVVSTQHDDNVSNQEIEKDIKEKIIDGVIKDDLLDKNTKIIINPSGRFVIGGPVGDAGLTGRKIIVDTYGGAAKHGGGAFSGKDPTKVDRSAAYAARHIAKNVIETQIASKAEIQLSYAIGKAEPVSIMVNTFGTGKVEDSKIENAIKKVFDLRPSGIISGLDLRNPIYQQTATYGHFGRNDLSLPWEAINHAKELDKLF